MQDKRKLRHELKFYIHNHEYTGLRERIKSILKLDKNSVDENGYHIRSLYFDNIYESALHEKNDGILNRKKYRIRIYNKSDAVIKLERKNKWNQYVSKESASMTRAEVEALLRGETDFLAKAESVLKREFYFAIKHGFMKPAVVVDYVREAYIYSVSDVRITFDKQLSAGVQSFDIFDPDLVTRSMIEGPRTILEVKYNEIVPSHILQLLQMSAQQRSTISKYAICKESRKVYSY